MSGTGFERECPRCHRQFAAQTDRGICPSCGLFSRIDRNGTPVGVIRTYDTVELSDWPYESVDEHFALALQGFANGGGPLFVAERYDDYPELAVVHKQLAMRFDELHHSVTKFVPDCTLRESPEEVNDLMALSPRYGVAQRLRAVSWLDNESRYDLVECLTTDGGSVDALLDGDALWHPQTA